MHMVSCNPIPKIYDVNSAITNHVVRYLLGARAQHAQNT